MTQEQIREAIDEFKRKATRSSINERAWHLKGIDEEIVLKILFALRFTEKCLAEPSEGMIEVGTDDARWIGVEWKTERVWRVMVEQACKEVQGEKNTD